MRILDLIHRWTGGMIGLLLAVLGLSGTLLLHKDAYLRATLPHAADAPVRDGAAIADTVTRLFADPSTESPRSITLAGDTFGLHRINYGDDVGAYADQSGNIVTSWTSVWERPEIWLFDLHHHLLNGETGETVAGFLGLIGIGFVITGAILWWRTRKTFAFRLLPKRLTRPAITRQHRDLGIVMAPLLLLSMLTGTMMVLRPVANVLLSPLSAPAGMNAALAQPKAKGGALTAPVDWHALIQAAHARYPDGELRILSVPTKPGGLINVRMRQQAEWLPNGRTAFWFDPADGRLIESRDALAMPPAARAFNLLYPLHAAKVGGLAYQLVMTLSGLALTLLGTLTVFSFWTAKGQALRQRRRLRHSIRLPLDAR